MYATYGERRIFFDVHGQHTGWRDGVLVERPVILVVHGGPGLPHVYLRPWLATLAEDYCLVFLDLRGAGWSSRHPGSGYPLAGFVEDVELVRSTLGVERVVPLGHSFGGPVVMEYALAYPDHVEALVLACTIADFVVHPLAAERQAQRMSEPALGAALIPFGEKLARAFGGDQTAWDELDVDPAWNLITNTQFMSPPPPAWAVAAANMRIGSEAYGVNTALAMAAPEAAALGGWDIRPRLCDLNVPTLVLAADSAAEYAATVEPHARDLASGIQDAILQVVAGHGHYLFAEDPASFCDPIRQFLDDVGLPGAMSDVAMLRSC